MIFNETATRPSNFLQNNASPADPLPIYLFQSQKLLEPERTSVTRARADVRRGDEARERYCVRLPGDGSLIQREIQL